MKRWIGIVITLVLLFTMTACRTAHTAYVDGASAKVHTTTTDAATSVTTAAVTTTSTTATTSMTTTAATTITTTTTTITTTVVTTMQTPPPTEAPTTPPTQPPTTRATAAPTAPPTTKPTTAPTVATKAAEGTKTVTADALAQIKAGCLRLINEERARVGVGSLAEHGYLSSCAQVRSEEITRNWSHDRPDGSPFYSVIQAYPYAHAGENICMTPHFGGGSYTAEDLWTGSAAQIEQAYTQIYLMFRNSDGHYRNFTDGKYRETGVGITVTWLTDGIPMFYVSHLFGTQV